MSKENLEKRAAATPVPFPKSRICGLCDLEKPFLIAMKSFSGKGGLFACSTCVIELIG